MKTKAPLPAWLLIGALALCSGLPLAAEPPWHGMQLVGSARLSFLLWPVYDAHLYTPTGNFDSPAMPPFALQLEYWRDFPQDSLVAETRRQWQAQGVTEHPDWTRRLAMILPDVSKSDTITLYVDGAGNSTFYFNDTTLGTIADSTFSQAFAGIWLSPATTRPDLREALLGRNDKNGENP